MDTRIVSALLKVAAAEKSQPISLLQLFSRHSFPQFQKPITYARREVKYAKYDPEESIFPSQLV